MMMFTQHVLFLTFKSFIMSSFSQICGIDVSKDTLDYCLLKAKSESTPQYDSINNDMKTIAQQFSCSIYENTLFVVEPTGNYSAKVLHQLSELGRAISLVSPLQSKSFMAALGTTNKNDKQAALSLTLMGQRLSLRAYKAPTKEMQERKQALTTLRALEKQARMLKNQLHALDQLPMVASRAKAPLTKVLDAVEQELEMLRTQLYQTAEDPEYNEKIKCATSVVGIGPKTAEAMMLVTNGLNSFDSPDKLAKFLGITPHSHYSGSSVRRRGKITKYGSNEVRRLLYCCTGSAIRHNKACKELYLRLRRVGKPHKLAAVAVMHKLVKQFFVCVKQKVLFDNEYHLKNQTKQ